MAFYIFLFKLKTLHSKFTPLKSMKPICYIYKCIDVYIHVYKCVYTLYKPTQINVYNI